MLPSTDGSSQRRLETVHGAGPDDPAKAAERFTAAFGVIRQVVQPCWTAFGVLKRAISAARRP